MSSLAPLAVLVSLSPLPAQDPVFPVPGTATLTKAVQEGNERFGFVSRDAGRTWRRQGAIDHELHLRHGSFDPTLPPVVPESLRAPDGNRLFVVQLHTPIIAEFRSALLGLGAELHHYLPSQCYLVRMDRELVERVAALPFVRAVLPYHVVFRLDPDIVAEPGNAGERARYTVVFVDKRRDARGLERRAVALGGTSLIPSSGGILFEAMLTREQMLGVAGDDRTLWIEPSSMPERDIDNARIQGGTNYVDSVAGIRGAGMAGHVMEGVYRTHPEFAAIPGIRSAPIAPFDGTAASHGNATAGEIYARGVSPLYKGLMPNAQLVYTNYNYVINKSTRYGVTQSVIANQDVMLDTASWGYSRTLSYTARSAEMDDIIFDLGLFITQSQSNAGGTSQPRNSRPQAWAKNICSVGGFRHRNNASRGDDYWGRSGSTGPASDGRIGVTLSAYYDSIRTTSGSTGYTTGFGGTSGATPIINGLGGNVIEMFTDGLFGYPKTAAKTSVERIKVAPSFSTTKALLVATATQLVYNSSGVSVGANRYQQGFGFPNVRRAYDERDRLFVIDEQDVLAQGQSRLYFLFARGGRFHAAMNYPDPEAAANAGIHRINSVDLQVVTSDGTTYWGNNGLVSGPNSTPGGSANDRDTEESVILDNAPKGLTQVSVRATAVRRDGHVETPAFDVDYALAVDGLGGLRDTTGLKLDTASSGPGIWTVTLTNLPAGWKTGYTVFSLATSGVLSTGNLFGLEADALALALVQLAPMKGGVFAFTSDASANEYPNATFTFDPGLATALKGVTFDAVAWVADGSGNILAASNVDRVKIQ